MTEIENILIKTAGELEKRIVKNKHLYNIICENLPTCFILSTWIIRANISSCNLLVSQFGILWICFRNCSDNLSYIVVNKKFLCFCQLFERFHKSQLISSFRSSHQRCSIRKDVLKNFKKFTGKLLCQSLFYNKVAGLRPAALLKKRLWHKCFPVNFGKYLRVSFLQDTFGRLLLFITSLHITEKLRGVLKTVKCLR